MPGFVKMATLDELPPGGSKEVEHDGRIYALFNVDGVSTPSTGSAPTRGGRSPTGRSRGRPSPAPGTAGSSTSARARPRSAPKIKQAVYEVKVEGQDVLIQVA